MTREELEKAIENGESMYVVDDKVIEVELNPESESDLKSWDKLYVKVGNNDYKTKFQIDRIFKTKAEAEHYLHHANIIRTETLPFLTWEEFLKKEYIEFFNGGRGFRLYISHSYYGNIRISAYAKFSPGGNVIFDEIQTEENFYKAYDECVRLFKGDS